MLYFVNMNLSKSELQIKSKLFTFFSANEWKKTFSHRKFRGTTLSIIGKLKKKINGFSDQCNTIYEFKNVHFYQL